MTIATEGTTANPSKLYAKKLVVYTKSLGRIYTAVCSIATPGTDPSMGLVITSSAGAYPSNVAYVWDASDYVLISSV